LIERIPGPFASLYEKATRLAIETYYSEVAREVVSFLRAGRILDLGTGPGYLPVEIAKRAPSLKVDGIDLSPSLIRMAQKNASKAGVEDRVRFEVGDASHLKCREEAYDMVISTGMLHMLKDPAKVLKECYRVLRPGREAWIFDPARISSQVNVKKWRASLTVHEKAARLLFRLYARIHPSRTYEREELAALVAETPFNAYWIREYKGEIKLRLKK
ncbi:MAG: class I SAM-dependent methyltransferase, partial [Pseudomonadota bacterium]